MKNGLLCKLMTLGLSLLLASACTPNADSDYCTVSFDANTSLKTTNVMSQSVKNGGKIKKPSVSILDDNPDNLKVYAWYTGKDLSTEWNFKKDTVTSNMTLYAEWKKTFTVNYYVPGDSYPQNTLTVFEGETVKEHPDYVAGYEYLGSYTDPEYTTPFDYSAGITSDVNIYMKRSDGIDLYESNPAGGLYDNLNIFSASNKSSTPEEPEVGSISKTSDKDAVYIDFGYSPDYADPYIELDLNLDISKSQVLHFEMKHFGLGNCLTFYFTTLLDLEKYNYSATGKNYDENFTARYDFKADEIGMSEDDDYVDIAVDLAANSMFYGYSVWGTSPYLGKIRIQANYTSTSADDRSNTMLLRRIYGSNEGYENGVVTKDSDEISAMLQDSSTLPSQDPISTGFNFPLDFDYVTAGETADVYKRENGLLMHFDNEIDMRSAADRTQSVTMKLPTNDSGDVIGDKIVDLSENRALYLTLTNLGYASSLRVVIENDYGGKTYTDIKLDKRMLMSKTYSINLSKEALMIHTLLSITFEYTAVGVDNAILLSDIYLGETRPVDIPGISFDDKNCFGLTDSGTGAEVAYSESYSAAEINVTDSGAVLTSNKENIYITDVGYYGVSLSYSRSKNSEISGVYVSFMIGGSYGTEYYFETPSITKSSTQVDMDPSEGGVITGIKIRFDGAGTVRINSIDFVVDDLHCFDMSQDMSSGIYSDWMRGYTYSYDDALTASTLIADASKSIFSASFYLGIGNSWYGHNIYNCQNLELQGKSKIVIVYHNDSDPAVFGISPQFTSTIVGNPDSETVYDRPSYAVEIRGNMAEYEWDSVSIAIPAGLGDSYIGKFTICNFPTTFSIRLIAVI